MSAPTPQEILKVKDALRDAAVMHSMARDIARKNRLARQIHSAGVDMGGKFLRPADLPPREFGNRKSRRGHIARAKRG